MTCPQNSWILDAAFPVPDRFTGTTHVIFLKWLALNYDATKCMQIGVFKKRSGRRNIPWLTTNCFIWFPDQKEYFLSTVKKEISRKRATQNTLNRFDILFTLLMPGCTGNNQGFAAVKYIYVHFLFGHPLYHKRSNMAGKQNVVLPLN